MKFLDNNLKKDSSLLLHAIHSLLYWRILKKIIFFFVFKNPYKKSAEQETLVGHEQHLVEQDKEGRKPQKFESETTTKNAVQEYHL